MPEQSEDPEIFAAAAILMRMRRAEDSKSEEDSSATVTPALQGAHHGAVNIAMGLHWEPQRVSPATGRFHLQSLNEQKDQEMMDVGEESLYKNDHAASSAPDLLHPNGQGGREQRTIPRFDGFHNAESILDADETRRLAGWRRESSWGVAGLSSGTFWRGYTKNYDDTIAAQHVNYAD
ncbi:hypothetical protein KC363_g6718 [Hortaea werneckii]|nr:hypothetical protein KC363_g6718 [Hortaea werneckii]